MDGVINFYKPEGMTSHDAVYFFRRLLNIKKIGHTGTLDPNATGVLPICIGKATRVSEYLLDVEKEYIGELSLGAATDTLDGDGSILNTSDIQVTDLDIENAFSKYRGIISQTPPMYSAIRINGKRLYELAREGIEIERKSRDVNIYKLDIMNIKDNKRVFFYTKCSKGTYIRTLCDDIGFDLGTYGFMSYLIRVGVGNFKLDDSYGMEYLKSLTKDNISQLIIPMDEAIDHLGKVVVPDNLYSKLINGVKLSMGENSITANNTPLRIYCMDKFIGIGKIVINENDNDKFLKMDKVLI